MSQRVVRRVVRLLLSLIVFAGWPIVNGFVVRPVFGWPGVIVGWGVAAFIGFAFGWCLYRVAP